MIYLIGTIVILFGTSFILSKMLIKQVKEYKELEDKFDNFKTSVKKLKESAIVSQIIEVKKDELNEELKGATDEESKIIINNNLSVLNEL